MNLTFCEGLSTLSTELSDRDTESWDGNIQMCPATWSPGFPEIPLSPTDWQLCLGRGETEWQSHSAAASSGGCGDHVLSLPLSGRTLAWGLGDLGSGWARWARTGLLMSQGLSLQWGNGTWFFGGPSPKSIWFPGASAASGGGTRCPSGAVEVWGCLCLSFGKMRTASIQIKGCPQSPLSRFGGWYYFVGKGAFGAKDFEIFLQEVILLVLRWC